MADHNKAALLSLPRELRNRIYDYLTKTVHVTNMFHGSVVAGAKLHDTIMPELLRVNRQFAAEYSEQVSTFTFELLYNSGSAAVASASISLGCVRARTTHVPSGVLAKVSKCELVVLALETLESQPLDPISWLDSSSLEQVLDQKTQFWTPTQALCSTLRNFTLKEIASRLPSNVKVEISFNVYGLDLDMFPRDYEQFMDSEFRKKWRRLLDLDEISRLATDTTLPWPSRGCLSVGYYLRLPLYNTLPSNWAQMQQHKGDLRAGLTPQDIEPDFEPSASLACFPMVQDGDSGLLVQDWGASYVIERKRIG